MQKAWLHCRDLILRILVAAVMCGRDRGGAAVPKENGEAALTNGTADEGKMAAVVTQLLPRFQQHMEACAKEYPEPAQVGHLFLFC